MNEEFLNEQFAREEAEKFMEEKTRGEEEEVGDLE